MHYQPNIPITEGMVAWGVTVNNPPEFFQLAKCMMTLIQNKTSIKHVPIKLTQLHPVYYSK